MAHPVWSDRNILDVLHQTYISSLVSYVMVIQHHSQKNL